MIMIILCIKNYKLIFSSEQFIIKKNCKNILCKRLNYKQFVVS